MCESIYIFHFSAKERVNLSLLVAGPPPLLNLNTTVVHQITSKMHLNATILHADNLSEKTHLLLQTYLYKINVLYISI